jgi:HAD superfamily hydrolase (TIGR01490 family)
VYREAVDLAAEHTGRGEPVFIVSAALYEVVETIAQKLGLAGALASRAEVDDGVYTGRLERRLYGPEKATALVELTTAEGLELASSTAYSDSHSDLPFLEAVGHPVVVNPDRALARVARARDWPVRRFRHRLGRP